MPGLNTIPEREEDIDFSDIYKKHHIDEVDNFDTIVVVDGAPIVNRSKEEKLLTVLKKFFIKEVGNIKDGGIWMPMSPNEKGEDESKGYLFIEFETSQSAADAVFKRDFRFTKTQLLSVHNFSDVMKYTSLNDDFKEPETEEYEEKGHIKSWLTDEKGRDQFVVCHRDPPDNNVSVFWNNRLGDPDLVQERLNWTESTVEWSPLGSYLATIHSQGFALWSGPSWEKIRVVHPNVRHLVFSPNERYVITFSQEEINLNKIPKDVPHKFNEDDNGKHIVVWDIKTGERLRSFKANGYMFKWSASGKYIARIDRKSTDTKSIGDRLCIYEVPSMNLLDKKSISAPIANFEWSPAKPSNNDEKKEEVLAYWAPRIGDLKARVTVLAVPSKKVIGTRNFGDVAAVDRRANGIERPGVKLTWQSQGRFLSAEYSIDAKIKKWKIAIFHATKKDVPVEDLDIQEPVLDLQWEPNGERFAIITEAAEERKVMTAAGEKLRPQDRSLSLFHLDRNQFEEKFAPLKTINKSTQGRIGGFMHDHIYWSPKGRHFVIASLRMGELNNDDSELEFFDMDFETPSTAKKTKKNAKKESGSSIQSIGKAKHYNVDGVCWDPSGQYVISSISNLRTSKIDSSYNLWDFKGQGLFEGHTKGKEKHVLVQWRPRPKSLLSDEEKEKILANLKQYSKEFEDEDLKTTDAALAERLTNRRKAFEEWTKWEKEILEKLTEERKKLDREIQMIEQDEFVSIEEQVEEVIEEIEEFI